MRSDFAASVAEASCGVAAAQSAAAMQIANLQAEQARVSDKEKAREYANLLVAMRQLEAADDGVRKPSRPASRPATASPRSARVAR